MSPLLSPEHQSLVSEAACHEVRLSGAVIRDVAGAYERPSAIYRPSLHIDGNQWCALYGDNLQDGVAGFGDSPAAAMWDFDKAWAAKLPLTKEQP